jgi:hypothetical protein
VDKTSDDTRRFTQDVGTRKRNDELYPLVAKADRAAMDEMILLNMAMVKHNVKLFLARNPGFAFLHADLISQATIGLVQAVNKMAGINDEDDGPDLDNEKPNPTSLIGTFIFYRLGELIDSESGLRVPGRSLRRKAKDGFIPPSKEATIDSSYVFEREGLVDPRSMVDLEDEIIGCCDSEQDRQIVTLRKQGRSDQDISEIMGIPRSTVQLMRQSIYERFKERNDECDD